MTRGRAGWIVALVLLTATLGPRPQAQVGRGQPVQCVVPISTATTIQAVGGDCAAKPGLRLWITDVNFSTSAAGVAADSFNTLKSGTGTTCGTGTAVVWGALSIAASQYAVVQAFATPLVLPVASDLCWINSSAGSKFLIVTGYYTP